MKTAKIIFLLIGLLFGIGYAVNPQILRILIYQKPTTQTFRHFPLQNIAASRAPSWFTRIGQAPPLLDTLHVDHAGEGLIPFSEYFEKGKLLAFLVIRRDTIIYEKYAPGFSDTTLSNVFSIGKSMLSVAVGKALAEGHFASLDQPLTDYLPEFEDHPHFANLTLRHLLNMKSGIRFVRTGAGPFSDLFSDEARYFYTDDLKRDLLQVEPIHLPGQHWHYSNIDPLLLTWALERATKESFAQYFQKRIWDPIGAEYPASWGLDHAEGLANTPSSFQCTAIDLAKIGRLYLNSGKRDSIEIIPKHWIDSSLHVQASNRENTQKGWQQSTHQHYWWLPQAGQIGDFSAEGLRGQRLYVHPANQLIIVQLAESGYGGYPYRKIADFFAKSRTSPR